MAVVVALAVLSIILGAATWQILAHRRTLQRQLNEGQAVWLARAGIERAAARLLADPSGYTGESPELIPHSQLRVTVQRAKDQAETFEVTSEARFPTDNPNPVVRSLSRRFRRAVEDEGTRLAVE
jgi:type II secretory pathway component PulK